MSRTAENAAMRAAYPTPPPPASTDNAELQAAARDLPIAIAIPPTGAKWTPGLTQTTVALATSSVLSLKPEIRTLGIDVV